MALFPTNILVGNNACDTIDFKRNNKIENEMTEYAKIIEDSQAPNGVRLTTLQLRYPRFIHAEFMTHRVFSRNASSSRAIPVAKMIEQIRVAPAMPLHWGKNQPGMQANFEVDDKTKAEAQRTWTLAAESAIEHAIRMNELGVHKQIVNRILEPFMFISVIVTATEWDNFFELRVHPDAQPEIFALSSAIRTAMCKSNPRLVLCSKDTHLGWHLPYITETERNEDIDPETLAKISAARCARVSYLTHDGDKPSIEKDISLYEKLVGGRPLHASPVEHQAYPLDSANQWNKNFRGWYQHRSFVEENM